ncbi:MAG TPA: hypothetical protein VIN34_00310 [Candidatus Limnocylindria bacterium]|jgi:hypothetical protein
MSVRRSITTLIAVAIVLGVGAPAAAWDPGDRSDPFDPPIERPSPGSDALPGIYAVTDAYAGDYVARDGAVTTYGTATVHGPTDAYARVLDAVATGAASLFDGTPFNGRSVLTDGRPVAGTFYESFFRGESGYISLGIVFFQDDTETARSAPGPALTTIAVPGPSSIAAPQAAAPEPLAGGRIEVLRGRRSEIWLGALPAGASWRFVGGEAIVLGARAGTAAQPFVARWDRLAAPQTGWPLSFEVLTADAAPRVLVIEVTVRSPGLVE